jgi:glycosyltransferase involved in cell wall biosynthesis
MKSVAVVTATTGRDTLLKAIKSVQAQTYPCTHYVFFDGVPVNIDIPEGVKVIALPVKTGGNSMMNGGVCAAAAYLTVEDYICFLDDDNWFEPNHVESLVNVIGNNEYAYSLRKLVEPDGTFFANDDGEATGHFGDLVDVNCYFMKRELCAGIAPLWYKTNGHVMVGDRYVWATLTQSNVPYAATGQYTVNYRMASRWNTKPYFFLKNIQKQSQYPNGFPWRAA